MQLWKALKTSNQLYLHKTLGQKYGYELGKYPSIEL